jgi:Flp pilus assembly protein TadG
MTRQRRRHSRAGRVRDERGATAVELVLMAWVLVGFIMTVVGAGRFVDGRGQVNDAAYAAARAASLAPNLDAAREAGQNAAQESLADRGKACTTLTVSLAGTDFRTAGQVRAEVTCQADLSDVVGFGLPGTKSFTATAVVPIEQYRKVSGGFTNPDARAAGNSGVDSWG